MKRPLAVVCLIYLSVVGIFLCFRPPDFDKLAYAQEKEYMVQGRVYKIESKEFFGKKQSVLYLNQISCFQENSPDSSKEKNNGKLPEGLVCYVNDIEFTPKIGSIMRIVGEFELYPAATNPGEFDARIYYSTIGIEGKINNGKVIAVSKDYKPVADIQFKFRTFLEDRLKRVYPEKEAGIMMTMLLGNKENLDKEVKDLYQDAGILHILSVSGLHISVLGYGVYRLLGRMRIPVNISIILSVAWMWFYGGMIGMGVSAFRAIVMFSIKMLALHWKRTYDLITALAVAAVLLISSNPLYLYHSGFWLSFSCVLAISLLYPVIKLDERKGGYSYVKVGSIKICNSFLLSFSVTVFTLPVLLWFYYEVSLWGLLWNILVVPLAGVVMGGGIASLCLPVGTGRSNWFVGIVSVFIVRGNCFFLNMFEGLCRISEGSKAGNLIMGKPAAFSLGLFVAGMVVFILIGKKMKYYKRILILLSLVCLLILKGPVPFTITFLDVGQGDCICIQNDNGNVYLVDGGSSDKNKVGEYQILPFLKHEGISSVSAVFLSHGDSDHTSGIEELLQLGQAGVTVEKVVLPALEEAVIRKEFGRVISLCEEYGTRVYVMKQGESVIDGKLMLTALHPSPDYIGDSNEASQVLYLSYGEFTVLLTGDVEGDGEQELIRALKEEKISKVNLLKVAHHGSSGTTSEKLLGCINPDIGIISCGVNNSYGHPHEETLERLTEAGSEILTTPQYGAITIKVASSERILVSYGRKGILSD